MHIPTRYRVSNGTILTCKVLAVKVGDRAGGTSQHLQHLHVSAGGRQVERRVALAVGEVDRGPGLHQQLDYVGLSGDDGQVERRLQGYKHIGCIFAV